MRYDFPNRELALRRAAVRAKRRNVPMFVYKSALGYSISFTEPLLHAQYESVTPEGVVIAWRRERLQEATKMQQEFSRETAKAKRLTRPKK